MPRALKSVTRVRKIDPTDIDPKPRVMLIHRAAYPHLGFSLGELRRLVAVADLHKLPDNSDIQAYVENDGYGVVAGIGEIQELVITEKDPEDQMLNIAGRRWQR